MSEVYIFKAGDRSAAARKAWLTRAKGKSSGGGGGGASRSTPGSVKAHGSLARGKRIAGYAAARVAARGGKSVATGPPKPRPRGTSPTSIKAHKSLARGKRIAGYAAAGTFGRKG